MLCNPISYYPNKIDEMTFFQDNNLKSIEIVNHYNSLIAKGKYSEASDYINQQDGVYGFFADFFNLIENRIYNLQEHLLQKPQKKQPFIYYDLPEYYFISDLHIFSNENYITINNIHVFSDIDEEEDISLIKLFSDDTENGDNLRDIPIYVYEHHEDCDIEEDMSSIFLFTDNDEQPNSINDICIFVDEEEGEPSDVNKDTIWI